MKRSQAAKDAEVDTRTRILDAAIALLIRQGGAEVSMAEIGRAAGVSRQAVYLHFADRGDLFVALVQYADERRGLEAELEKIRNAPTGVAAVRAMASLQARTNGAIWPLAHAADAVRRTDEAMEKAWQDRLRHRHQGCKAIVHQLVKDGSLRAGLAPDVATDLLWSITSLRMWEDLVLQRRWTAKAYEQHITDLLLRTLAGTA